MSTYKQKKLPWWSAIAKFLRGIVSLFRVWPLLLVVAFIVSPISPHLRWDYSYNDYGTYRVYYRCTYLGAGGFVNDMHGDDCPLIVLIHRR